MMALVQRVKTAHVEVDNEVVGAINQGLLVLLGIHKQDTSEELKWVARKVANLRVFMDQEGKMNRSLIDIDGEALIVSQFTLYGNTRKGNRPSFVESAHPPIAEPLYEQFIEEMNQWLNKPVATGVFGAMMDVHLINDGPVTLVVEKKKEAGKTVKSTGVCNSLLLYELKPRILSAIHIVFRYKLSNDKLNYMADVHAFTHVKPDGGVKMVDIAEKPSSVRTAVAGGRVLVGEDIYRLVEENKIRKGDVLSIAQIAGIMGAKQTSKLIPLCHDVALKGVDIEITLQEEVFAIEIKAFVKTVGHTGVEMEALTGVSVAALTIYDMCKSVSKEIRITDIHLLAKTGGQSGDYRKEDI